jgi:hypothetical protein
MESSKEPAGIVQVGCRAGRGGGPWWEQGNGQIQENLACSLL